MEQLSNRIRNLETAENPIVYNVATSNVSSPPTQGETNTAFGATAAQVRDGWSGVIFDNIDSLAWLATSINDSWWFVNLSTSGVGPHTILNAAVHTDSVTQAVSAGSLIYGNATPKWDKTTHLTWDETNDLMTINPQLAGGIRFTGATTFNRIRIPDNIANALFIDDDNSAAGGSPTYMQFVSSDVMQNVNIFPTGTKGRVGICTDTPDLTLHVQHRLGSSGGAPTWNTNQDLAVFEGQSGQTCYVHILTDQTSSAGYVFSDTAAGGRVMGAMIYNHNSNYLQLAVAAGRSCHLTGSGFNVGPTFTAARNLQSQVSDANLNTVIYALRLTHEASGAGVPLNGFGTGIEYELEDAGNTNRIAAEDAIYWNTAAAATRSASRYFTAVSNTSLIEFLRFTGSSTQPELVINDGQTNIDLRYESDAETHALFYDATTEMFGVNQNSPAAKQHITQDDNAFTLPVLLLEQDDVDEPFIEFYGTSSGGVLTNNLVIEADVTTATRIGFAKAEVRDKNGALSSDCFLAVYTLA